MQVGTRVGIHYSEDYIQEAVVIEDRGDLGRGGEQIVRLAFTTYYGEERETESPVSDLVPPPDLTTPDLTID